ncbi:MAG: serpin family protein [Campylobacterales bacterium]|nr:serpin family protein [Campylobacterales bacterium]
MTINLTRSALTVCALSLMLLHGCQNGSGTHTNDPSSSSSTSDSQSSVATSSQEQSSSSAGAVLIGELIKDAARGVIDASALVRANTQFNSDLYKGLKEDGKNLFYSSYSIFSALSMTYAGAMNTTKQEFETLLHFDANLSVHESFDALLSQSSYAHNTFNIANSLWPQEGYPFKENYLYTVQTAYHSEINYQNYALEPEAARQTINGWVEEKTQEKIVDLIPPAGINELTRMVLVNALYFKGVWEYEFDINDTDKQPFYQTDGMQTEVDMMHMESELNYAETTSFQMLELPYKEHEFSMLLFLPKHIDDMGTLEEYLFTQYSPLQLRDALRSSNVIVSLPKFKIKWGTYSIVDFLKLRGMIEAFDPSYADFTGMWHRQTDENLYISDVVHQTFIEVNEEGAEAAAATAVIVSETSGGIDMITPQFNADHPFIFFIVDNKTGMIIFGGKLEVPEV